MNVSKSPAGFAATLLLLNSLSAVVIAQDRRDAKRAGSLEFAILEEVVVTAERREERLQNVPISVTALSSEQLERQQISNLDALQYTTPSFTNTPSQTSRTSAGIAMRGQYVRDNTPTIDPAIGLYLDGVYIARAVGANLDLIDMERVEVLRGPQGTLFGRNTTGGAINLIPRRPSSKFEALLKAGAGNYARSELAAILNAPLVCKQYAMRLTASHTEHRGYGRNTLLGKDLNDDDTDFVRAQLRFAPADWWNLNLSFDYSRINTGSQLQTLLYVVPNATRIPLILGRPGDNLANYLDPLARTVLADRAGAVDTNVWGVAGTLTMELARLTFKSITAYRSLKTHAFDSDQDGTPYDLGVILYRGDRQHQFSQEFQAYGAALNDRLNWISGLHYLVEGATFDQQFRIFVPPTSSWSENQPSGNARNDSLAAYGQVTYALTPTLRITAGARYNEDARQLTSRNARRVGAATFCTLSPALRDQTGLCQATLPERKFRYLPWTVGFDFKPVEQAMLYAKLSRGYRAGGYNVRGTTQVDLATFDPERVTEVEVGAKAELFSHRLRLNLALFRSLFDNIQLSQREMTAPGIPGTAFIANGGEAKVEGAELEVTALLGRLRLGGSVGILHPAFTKLNPNVVGVTLDSKFRNTPESNASLVADLPILTGFAEVNLHADYSWRDNMSFSYDPTSPARQAAYGLLNAMVSIRFDRADLELALWARNLADRRYITYAFENGFYISATPGDPRTFGASLAYRFGAE